MKYALRIGISRFLRSFVIRAVLFLFSRTRSIFAAVITFYTTCSVADDITASTIINQGANHFISGGNR